MSPLSMEIFQQDLLASYLIFLSRGNDDLGVFGITYFEKKLTVK